MSPPTSPTASGSRPAVVERHGRLSDRRPHRRGVRAKGVTPFYKLFSHDGVTGPNMATVYSDRGHGVRAPVVFYNRANEAAAQLKPGDFDWKRDLRRRRALVPQRRHFRCAVGNHERADHRGDDSGEGGRRGRLVRPQLPGEALEHPGGPEKRVADLRAIVENVDVLVGNEEDLQKGARHRWSRCGRRRVEARPERLHRHDRAGRERNTRGSRSSRPPCETSHSTSRHSWSAVASIDGQFYMAPDMRSRRARPCRRRRRLRGRPFLRPVEQRDPQHCVQSRLGARRAADDVPGRHHHGHAEPG